MPNPAIAHCLFVILLFSKLLLFFNLLVKLLLCLYLQLEFPRRFFMASCDRGMLVVHFHLVDHLCVSLNWRQGVWFLLGGGPLLKILIPRSLQRLYSAQITLFAAQVLVLPRFHEDLLQQERVFLLFFLFFCYRNLLH